MARKETEIYPGRKIVCGKTVTVEVLSRVTGKRDTWHVKQYNVGLLCNDKKEPTAVKGSRLRKLIEDQMGDEAVAGLSVTGEKLNANQPRRLRNGDRVRHGSWRNAKLEFEKGLAAFREQFAHKTRRTTGMPVCT